jgi:predicted phosphodiesterase
MKLAVLGDIHGNYVALQACLAVAEQARVDGFVFLGDFVTDCPYPQKTMDLVYDCQLRYPCWCIRGNREEYLLRHQACPTGWKYSSNSGSLLYTFESLRPEDLAFFASLPATATIELEPYPALTLCHGSPHDSRQWLLPDTELSRDVLENLQTPYLLCAHTHRPMRFELSGKTLINCGSVGVPTNGQTMAQFALLEATDLEWQSQIVSVPYDIDQIVADFASSGLSAKSLMWARSTIKLLQTGDNHVMQLLGLAEQKARLELNHLDSSDIPERYWEEAARELGIIP